MKTKELKEEIRTNTLKYGKMSFEDYWKEYVDLINKPKILKYKKASAFKRLFLSKENSILKIDYVKHIAKIFYDRGRLQMVSEINLDNIKGK